MGFLDKVKNAILPLTGDLSGTPAKKRSQGNNQGNLVVEELTYAFEESLQTIGNTILFDTAYVAYVPKEYYNKLHLTFGIIAQETRDIFEKKIAEKLAANKKLKCTPLDNKWSFDIISLGEGCKISDVSYDQLEEQFVAVRSSLKSADRFDFSSMGEGDTIKTNRSQPSSTFNGMQFLNPDAIRGLKPSGNGYAYPIMINGTPVGEVGGSDKVLATLKADGAELLNQFGDKVPSFAIRVPDIWIGGSSAATSYEGLPLLRIKSEEVMNPHFRIRQSDKGWFEIYPVGNVQLGPIPLEKRQWTRLPDRNASIQINDIELIFNKK